MMDVSFGTIWEAIARDLPDAVAISEPGRDYTFAEFDDRAARLAAALAAAGVSGDGGAEIDHVELLGPPRSAAADGLNFVLCPGGAHDRSPCGTGTSALLAALHSRGHLALDRPWRQESVAGGRFTAWLSRDGEALVPHIRGRAFVTAQATLFFQAADPFRGGLPAS